MKKYSVCWGAERAVKEGRKVLFIDLEEKIIMDAKDITLELFVKADGDSTGRYLFYMECEEEDEYADSESA